MLQHQIKRGKLAWLGYRVGDTIHDLSYLRATPAWSMIEQLILAGNAAGAEQLYKTAFSIAACNNWVRFKSGYWGVQYAGHILHVRSTDSVEVYLLHANPNSQVPKDLAVKAAEIAYHIRRRWYDQKRAAEFARRDARRDNRRPR